MIEELILNNNIVKYQITFKNNKNTYFRFKREGYIQINASKYQSRKNIVKFIRKNSDSFVKKYQSIQSNKLESNDYYYFGCKYQKVTDDSIHELKFNHENSTIKEPSISVDQLYNKYKKMEKTAILEKLENLKRKYLKNGLINIDTITFKTQYMTSRFGSCNATKKTININLYLVNYDESYLEYVFLHEISHLVHQNHSSNFYLLLSKLSKNYKQLKKELNYKFNNR